MVSAGGSLADPFAFREVMKAHVRYDTRTVDEVLAAQEARRREQEQQSGQASGAPIEAGVAKPKQSQLDALADIFAKAKPISADLDE